MVRPVTVMGDVAPLLDTGVTPSVQVVPKLVTALPLPEGVTKLTMSWALPATRVGADG